MARRSNVLNFRKARQRTVLPPGPVRNGRLQFSRARHRPRLLAWPGSVKTLLFTLMLVPALLLGGMVLGDLLDRPSSRFYAKSEPAMPDIFRSTPPRASPRVMSVQPVRAVSDSLPSDAPLRVVWVDGDSGTIDGVRFRLYGVDAPESSPFRAGCERELRRAGAAWRAARDATDGKDVRVLHSYGEDRYGRMLVDLKADGRDLGALLIGQGHLKYWRYAAGQPKPTWCS